MAVFSKLPNYINEYFEYKTLIKINGRPTLDKLILVFKQLEQNAQRVPTTLGGGLLGYLGLILENAVYITIPGESTF